MFSTSHAFAVRLAQPEEEKKNAFAACTFVQAAIPGLRAGDESFGQLTSRRPKLRRSGVFRQLSALAAVTKQEAQLEKNARLGAATIVCFCPTYGVQYIFLYFSKFLSIATMIVLEQRGGKGENAGVQ